MMMTPYQPLSLYDKQIIVAQRGLAGNPNLISSIQRNLMPFGAYVDIPAENGKQQALELGRLAQAELFHFERGTEIVEHFKAIVANENENMDVFNSHPWSEEDIANIRKAGLIPYQSNTDHRFELNLLGEMQGTETRFKAFGNDPTSQSKAEAMNSGLLWASQVNRLGRTNNYIFRDAAIGGRGVSLSMLDPFDPEGLPLIKRCRPQEFLWDPVGAENGSLDGTKYLERVYYVDAEDLIWRYPLWSAEIDKYSFARDSRAFLMEFTLAKPKVHATKNNKKNGPRVYSNMAFRNPRKRILVTEFYRRGTARKYAVYDSIKNLDHIFDDVNHAAFFYRTLVEAYQYGVAASGGDPNIPVVAPPRLKGVEIVDQMVFAGSTLISVETMDGDKFPYHHFIPEFNNGEITGFFEHNKDNTFLKNRFRIYLDMLMSGIKGKTFYDLTAIEGVMTPQEFEENLTRPTKAIGLTLKANKEMKDVVYHVQPPNHGTLPQTILDYVQKDSDVSNGGLATIGTPDSSGMSGKAIRSLQLSASAGTVPLFKEWEYFLIEQGEALAYLLQFVSPLRMMATIDERNKSQYYRFIDDGIQSINDLKFTIRIEEIVSSPSDREVQANLLLELLRNNPAMLQYAFEEIADLSGVDRSRIERIMAKMMQDENFHKMLEERQQTESEHETETNVELRKSENMRKWRETWIAEHPPVKLNASAKVELGPAAISGILQSSGISADPTGVAADQSMKYLIEGAKDVMAQKNWNDNLLPVQKQQLAGSKANIAKKPATAKDKINRSRT